MKPNLSYWYGTKPEMEVLQEKCFQSYMADINNSIDYKTTTTKLTDIFSPYGEGDIWAMRIPSGIVKKQSLINEMNSHNTAIKIIKSKRSWSYEEPENVNN